MVAAKETVHYESLYLCDNTCMSDDWKQLAACKGRTEDMFPTTDSGRTNALSICAVCSVTTQCAGYALSFPPHDMYGIWAGMDSKALMREQMNRGIKPTKATLRQTVMFTE